MLIEIPRTAADPELPQIAAARAVVRLFGTWKLDEELARGMTRSL